MTMKHIRIIKKLKCEDDSFSILSILSPFENDAFRNINSIFEKYLDDQDRGFLRKVNKILKKNVKIKELCSEKIYLCPWAAQNGYLLILKYAHENNYIWDEWTCAHAAEYGHLDCLKYSHENGCPWNRWTCKWAAECGSLECLKYANKNGCDWDQKTMESAIRGEHYICFNYAFDNNCPNCEDFENYYQ
jgi:hypothetical protein